MPTPSYDVVLKEHNGQFVCRVKELNLVVSGDDLMSCVAETMKKRDAIIKDFQAAGLLHELPGPARVNREQPSSRSLGGELKVFSLKMLIVMVTFLALLAIALGQVVYSANRLASKLEVSAGEWKKPGKALERQLFLAADPANEPSPEKQEKVIQSIRVLVKRVKPYVDELRPLYSDQKPGP